jgi:hypothetical protein
VIHTNAPPPNTAAIPQVINAKTPTTARATAQGIYRFLSLSIAASYID